jgi:hypothetical protein
MTLNEVSPPGFGHTKGDKEKGVKKGGTAAAFDRARKEGRFKGSKSDMFAIMWSQKNKGDKPHYKPGTNKKFKKYQDEAFGFEIDKGEHKKASKKAKMRNLAKGNTNPNEKAAAEKKAGGPKLYGEANKLKTNNIPKREMKNINYRYKNLHKQDLTGSVGEEVQKEMTYQEAIDAGWEMSGEGIWFKETKLSSMQDNNLFGNAYAGSYEKLKKKIGSKKKHDKPAIQEASFKDYMAQAQAARDREEKRREDRKKADAQYSDTRKHGVRFYDKKGKGRIKSGKKIYDK